MNCILLDDICEKCKLGGDVSRLGKCQSKWGKFLMCELCGWKKQLKKFKTKEQLWNKKYPGREDAIKERKLAMRESRKRVSFKGIKIDLI